MIWVLDVFSFLTALHFNMVAASNAAAFLNVLDVVKAAPQAQPKTTWYVPICFDRLDHIRNV